MAVIHGREPRRARTRSVRRRRDPVEVGPHCHGTYKAADLTCAPLNVGLDTCGTTVTKSCQYFVTFKNGKFVVMNKGKPIFGKLVGDPALIKANAEGQAADVTTTRHGLPRRNAVTEIVDRGGVTHRRRPSPGARQWKSRDLQQVGETERERDDAARQHVDDALVLLEQAADLERGRGAGDLAEPLPHVGRADHVDQAGLVLEVEEDHALRGRRLLTVRDHAGDVDDRAVGQLAQRPRR